MRQYLFFSFMIGCLSFSASVQAQWVPTNGPYGGGFEALAISGTNLFAGADNGAIFRSTDSGATWETASNGLQDGYAVFSLAAFGTNLFEGGYGGAYLSTDQGNSWIQVSTGLPNANFSGATNVTCFAENGTNLFAGTGNGGYGVYLSTNNGTSWT
jgi:photosystem II stability/assembly factor-like uncharacterized protein